MTVRLECCIQALGMVPVWLEVVCTLCTCCRLIANMQQVRAQPFWIQLLSKHLQFATWQSVITVYVNDYRMYMHFRLGIVCARETCNAEFSSWWSTEPLARHNSLCAMLRQWSLRMHASQREAVCGHETHAMPSSSECSIYPTRELAHAIVVTFGDSPRPSQSQTLSRVRERDVVYMQHI